MSSFLFLLSALAKAVIGVSVSIWGVSSGQLRCGERWKRYLVVAVFAGGYYLMRFVYASHFYVEGPLIVCLLTSAMAYCLFEYKPAYALCIGCSVSLCLQASQLAVFTIAGTVVERIDDLLLSDPWFGVLLDGIGAVVSLPAIGFLRRQAEEGARQWIRWPHLLTLALPLMLFLFFSAWQMPSFDAQHHALEIAPLVLIGVVFLAVVFSVLAMFAVSRMAWQRVEIERLEIFSEDRYERLLDHQEERRELERLIHDLKNQLLCIRETDDPAVKQEHCALLESRLYELRHTRFTGNATMDALLNQKRREAQRIGIDFHIAPMAIPASFMSSMDICSLFGNAIDNAFDCCRREGCKASYVDVKMAQIGAYLSIVVVNPCSEAPVKQGESFVSAKRSGLSHGIGMANMRHVVEKYNGAIDFVWTGEEFVSTILIPNARETTRCS